MPRFLSFSLLFLLTTLLTTGCAPGAAGQALNAPPPPQFTAPQGTSLSAASNTKRPIGSPYAANGYWEYLPAGYGASKSPLIVFLHGIGENGPGDINSLNAVNANGPPKLINAGQWPTDRPFVVLSPQHPGAGCPTPSEIKNFIAYALVNYDVDPARVYLTGLSCGAQASASYLAAYGHLQIAAAVMISGDATTVWQHQGCNMVNGAALWSFHGDSDTTISINGDRATLPKFEGCPAPPRKDVRFTIYPGVGHDAWTRTYDLTAGNDIYSWMLGFTH